VLGTLVVPVKFHRVQLEYELREKTILLRQGLLRGGGNVDAIWELLLRSLPAFATLFRHALLELGSCQLVEAGGSAKARGQRLDLIRARFCNCLIFANGRLTPGLRTSTRCVADI